ARIEDLARQVATEAATGPAPKWARNSYLHPASNVLADVAVWRAANNVPDSDLQPTGRRVWQKAAATWQRRLVHRLDSGSSPALGEWGFTIDQLVSSRDVFTPVLASRLAAIHRAGLDASQLAHTAAGQGALPNEYASAALW